MGTKKVDWKSKLAEISAQYPEMNSNWTDTAVAGGDAFIDIIGDVIKAGGKRSGPGKRPALSRQHAEEELQRLIGQDYSYQEFHLAFKALTKGASIRGVANKVGLDKTLVHRLLRDQAVPSMEVMEQIAAGYRKHPSYFLEYRIAFCLSAIEQYLFSAPETSVVWFSKIRGR